MITADYIIAICSIVTILTVLIGVLWRFSRAVDRNTLLTQQILEQQKAQWNRIDEHGGSLDEHDKRIVKLETRLDYPRQKA